MLSHVDQRAYEALLERAHDYARTWWRDSADAQLELTRRSDLREQVTQAARAGSVSTYLVYFDADRGRWVAIRRRLHAAVRAALLEPPDVEATPAQLYLTCGPPGAGKSTVLGRLADGHACSVGVRAGVALLDADEVRVRLPEYAEGLGSSVVQAETVDVAYGPTSPRRASLKRSKRCRPFLSIRGRDCLRSTPPAAAAAGSGF